MQESIIAHRPITLRVARALALILALGRMDLIAQHAGLRIVVVEGEDAVNIIQQKSAVAPVVEVRDVNDQPVAGATVRFAIQGGRATFNGARTLTLTTNAAGRAAVTGLAPTGPGAVQINITAAFQGQSATATIAQTNFATAAQAASVGATASGGSSGAGTAVGAGSAAGAGTGAAVAAAGGAAAAGGLSAIAVTAIAGGAGAGALIAAKEAGVVGGDGQRTPCVFTVSPTTLSFSSAGGIETVSVDLAESACEPKEWTASTDAPFVGVMGAGERTAQLFVAINPFGNPARTGTATIAGQSVTITQSARCAFAVTPASLAFPQAGGSVVITVNISPDGCDNSSWTVSTISSFISFSSVSGSGNGSVIVTAAPRITPGLLGLTGNISIAGQIVPFIQQ